MSSPTNPPSWPAAGPGGLLGLLVRPLPHDEAGAGGAGGRAPRPPGGARGGLRAGAPRHPAAACSCLPTQPVSASMHRLHAQLPEACVRCAAWRGRPAGAAGLAACSAAAAACATRLTRPPARPPARLPASDCRQPGAGGHGRGARLPHLPSVQARALPCMHTGWRWRRGRERGPSCRARGKRRRSSAVCSLHAGQHGTHTLHTDPAVHAAQGPAARRGAARRQPGRPARGDRGAASPAGPRPGQRRAGHGECRGGGAGARQGGVQLRRVCRRCAHAADVCGVSVRRRRPPSGARVPLLASAPSVVHQPPTPRTLTATHRPPRVTHSTAAASSWPCTHQPLSRACPRPRSNVVDHPGDAKYRRVKADNAAYRSRLGCRPGGKEAMAALGFRCVACRCCQGVGRGTGQCDWEAGRSTPLRPYGCAGLPVRASSAVWSVPLLCPIGVARRPEAILL